MRLSMNLKLIFFLAILSTVMISPAFATDEHAYSQEFSFPFPGNSIEQAHNAQLVLPSLNYVKTANGHYSVKWDLGNHLNGTLVVYDVNGMELGSIKMEKPKGYVFWNELFPAIKLRPGMYLLELTAGTTKKALKLPLF